MARLKLVPKKRKPKFAVHTVSLTSDVVEAITQLSQDASDFLGRTVSGSAVIRALVRQMMQQDASAEEAMFLEIEKELNAGVLWGSKKQ